MLSADTTRLVCRRLREAGLKVVAVRHPMPYGDLAKQAVQRYATVADLAKHQCTVEEMEEYEPHIVSGTIIYAGVDYEAILRQAEEHKTMTVVNDQTGRPTSSWPRPSSRTASTSRRPTRC